MDYGNLVTVPKKKKLLSHFLGTELEAAHHFYFLVKKKWGLAKLCQRRGRALRLRLTGQPLWMPIKEGLLATGLEFRWVSAQAFSTEPSPLAETTRYFPCIQRFLDSNPII